VGHTSRSADRLSRGVAETTPAERRHARARREAGSEKAVEALFERYWPEAYRAAFLIARERPREHRDAVVQVASEVVDAGVEEVFHSEDHGVEKLG
jgi:hypothetical protein